jgi:AcrR family transcriptional regulator
MARRDRQPAPGKTPLTPAAVVEGALALADADGLAGVTIRRLAERLGVTPMALYWHVRNKDELLDGMAARIFDAVDPAVDPSAPWQEQLRALLGSLLAALRAHPAAATLVSTRTVSSRGSLDVTEAALDILRRAGFSPAEATQIARHALGAVVNFVAGEPGVVARDEAESTREARQRARLVLETLPRDRYPRLIEAAEPLSVGVDPDAFAAFGLDLLLAGIEAMAARNR